MTGNPPSEDDLFREAMGDVAPLEPGRRVQTHKPVDGPTEAQLARRDAALGLTDKRTDPNMLTLGEVPPRDPNELLEWKLTGVQRAVFAKLRKGEYPIEGRLDLHGLTVREARAQVFAFLNRASATGWRCVWIAHGKGEKSAIPARLKSYLAVWLVEHPEVIAYHSAQRQHGGVGAVYALVKKSPREKEQNREQHGLKSDPPDGGADA